MAPSMQERRATRLGNTLRRAGICSIEQAVGMSDGDLLAIRSFGVAMLHDLRDIQNNPSSVIAEKAMARIAPEPKYIKRLRSTLLLDRERAVLERRLFSNENSTLTYAQIGCEFGVSRERVRQILIRALRKVYDLRHFKDHLDGQNAQDLERFWPVVERMPT